MKDTIECNSKISADVTYLYSINICKDDYSKNRIMFMFTDNTNRYVWITTDKNITAKQLTTGKTYKISGIITDVLSKNEYKISRIKINQERTTNPCTK